MFQKIKDNLSKYKKNFQIPTIWRQKQISYKQPNLTPFENVIAPLT